MPKIFHVNWFRKSDNGKGHFLWPGFGENIRVLDWILKRTDNIESVAVKSPIGYVPAEKSIDFSGLNITNDEEREMLSVEKQFWLDEANELRAFFDEYVNDSTPEELNKQIDDLKKRVEALP